MPHRIQISDAVKERLLDARSLPGTVRVKDREYTLDRPVAAGVKAVVWKVIDEYGRPRALKLACYDDYIDRSYLEELSRAARLEQSPEFARFVDAEVVTIDLDDLGEQRFVGIVEEWIDGLTLESFLKDRREEVTVSFFLGYVRTLCRALLALQTQGLTHDDLHARNVMVAEPVDGQLSGERVFKVIDTGSLKPSPTKKEMDDHFHFVEHLVAIRNTIHLRRMLTLRERRFVAEADGLLGTMLDENSTIALRDPAQISEQFDLAFTRASAVRRPATDKMQSPFEFISAEHIADDSLLVEIFAKSCPWLEKVSGPDPCLVTGPRGCGKSTIFRWLSLKAHLHKPTADIEPLRIAGFYISCSADLQNRLGWIRDKATAQQFRREIVHYFNLLAAREIVITLELISNRPDRESHWGFGSPQERAIHLFIMNALGPASRKRVQGVSYMEQTIEAIEAEMFQTHSQMLRGLNLNWVTPETFLGDLTTALIQSVPAFEKKRIAFLVDDFSDHRLPKDVQAILNRIIWERRPSHIFKLSAEKYGALLIDEAGAPVDISREMVPVDCGREYIALDDSNRSQQARTFAAELLNLRLKKTGYAGTAESLIGDSRWPSRSLARALLSKKGRLADQYHGLACIADLCSGDIATLLQVYRQIFELAGSGKEATSRIPKRVQHQAIVNVSREQLGAIRAQFPYGSKMYDIATAFGTLVRNVLRSGRWQKKGRSTTPPMCPRIEVDQKRGGIVDQLNPEQQDLAKSLIKRSVFIEMPEGISRHDSLTTLRWHFRRVYLPAFGAALAKNDAVKVEPDWFKFFLTNPSEACVQRWQRWRKEEPGGSRQIYLDELEDGN